MGDSSSNPRPCSGTGTSSGADGPIPTVLVDREFLPAPPKWSSGWRGRTPPGDNRRIQGELGAPATRDSKHRDSALPQKTMLRVKVAEYAPLQDAKPEAESSPIPP